MRMHIVLPAIALAVALASPQSLKAQTPAELRAGRIPALSGQVASQEEGAMEGVLVSAKLEGGTVTITVVSDAEGKFSFPAAKLGPGKYALSIRAIGYELQGPRSVDLAADKPATAELK